MSGPNLLGRRAVVQESSAEAKEVVGGLLGGVSKRELRQIPLTSIRTKPQVRREFPEEAHRALVENIRSQGGVIEPVIVNLVPGDDKYLLVAGERRLRACKALMQEYEQAGDSAEAEAIAFIPAIVYEDLAAEQVREMQLSENLLREDLTDLEEALALSDLLAVRLGITPGEVLAVLELLEKQARGVRQKGDGHEEQLRVVEEVFSTFSSITWRTFVKKRQHLFRLPEDVLEAVRDARITSTQAELLGRLKTTKGEPKTEQEMAKMRANLMESLERGQMSLEELERAVRGVQKKPEVLQAPEVQVALRVRRSLTPKRLLSLPTESRSRVQELLEEVGRLLEEAQGVPGGRAAKNDPSEPEAGVTNA